MAEPAGPSRGNDHAAEYPELPGEPGAPRPVDSNGAHEIPSRSPQPTPSATPARNLLGVVVTRVPDVREEAQ